MLQTKDLEAMNRGTKLIRDVTVIGVELATVMGWEKHISL